MPDGNSDTNKREARGKRRTKAQKNQDSDNAQTHIKRHMRQREIEDNPAPTTQAKRLPFVKLADSVFDVLSQQTTFVWRHMSVTPTLIEIGGNCRTQHGV